MLHDALSRCGAESASLYFFDSGRRAGDTMQNEHPSHMGRQQVHVLSVIRVYSLSSPRHRSMLCLIHALARFERRLPTLSVKSRDSLCAQVARMASGSAPRWVQNPAHPRLEVVLWSDLISK